MALGKQTSSALADAFNSDNPKQFTGFQTADPKFTQEAPSAPAQRQEPAKQSAAEPQRKNEYVEVPAADNKNEQGEPEYDENGLPVEPDEEEQTAEPTGETEPASQEPTDDNLRDITDEEIVFSADGEQKTIKIGDLVPLAQKGAVADKLWQENAQYRRKNAEMEEENIRLKAQLEASPQKDVAEIDPTLDPDAPLTAKQLASILDKRDKNTQKIYQEKQAVEQQAKEDAAAIKEVEILAKDANIPIPTSAELEELCVKHKTGSFLTAFSTHLIQKMRSVGKQEGQKIILKKIQKGKIYAVGRGKQTTTAPAKKPATIVDMLNEHYDAEAANNVHKSFIDGTKRLKNQ